MWLVATVAFTLFAMFLVRSLKKADQEKSGGHQDDKSDWEVAARSRHRELFERARRGETLTDKEREELKILVDILR